MLPKKFLLIDQSIRGAGGHHLEYALRVLRAAEGAGFVPVLAAHKDFDSSSMPGLAAYSVFRRTFWENIENKGLVNKLRGALALYRARLRKSFHHWWQKSYYQFVYSSFGLDAQRSAEISGFGDPLVEIFSSELTKFPSAPNELRFWRLIHKLVSFARRIIGGAARAYGRLPRHFRRVLGAVFRLAFWCIRLLVRLAMIVFLAPLALLAMAALTILRVAGGDASPRKIFQQDLRSVISQAGLGAGDVVFMATLGELEMLAISDLCARSAKARHLNWRLMFRRNIMAGRANSYSSQNDRVEVRRFRLALKRACVKMKGVNLRFFTDTQQLTEQYNHSRIQRFDTAPVPVADELLLPSVQSKPTKAEESAAPGAPLVVGYIGDARDEKGFPLLADLMDLLYSDYLATGRLRLAAQSNFNVKGGEPGSAKAHMALSALPDKYCGLLGGPFESVEYISLLQSFDIVLIPYDQDNYAARSSGVFAEALAAGKPMIVTRGTWMAMVLEPYRQAYLEELRTKLPVPQKHDRHQYGAALERIRRLGDPTRGAIGTLTRCDRATHVYVEAELEKEDRRHHAVIILHYLDANGTEIGCAEETVWLCRKTVRVLVSLPKEVAEIFVRVQPLDSHSNFNIDRLLVETHRLHGGVPLSFGGVIVAPAADLVAEGVRDLVRNYNQYSTAAGALAEAWRPHLAASTLVSVLTDESFDAQSPEAEAQRLVCSVMSGQSSSNLGSRSTIKVAR